MYSIQKLVPDTVHSTARLKVSKQTIERYKSILDALMSFIDGLGEGEECGKEKVYSQ